MKQRHYIIPALLLAFLLWAGQVHGQTDSVYMGLPDSVHKPVKPERTWHKKMIYGGDFQAWIGNPTFILLAPTVGYTVFKNFNLSVGMIYSYSSVDYGPYGKFSQSIFGGHSLARYIIAENYFVQLQYDKLYQPDYFATEPGRRTWVDYLMAGGGFRQKVGDRIALTTSIMFNLTPNPLSIYASPIILQFGFVGSF